MNSEPQERIGVKDIDELKNHDFFKGVNWEISNIIQLDPPFMNTSSSPVYNFKSKIIINNKIISFFFFLFKNYFLKIKIKQFSKPGKIKESLLDNIGIDNFMHLQGITYNSEDSSNFCSNNQI